MNKNFKTIITKIIGSYCIIFSVSCNKSDKKVVSYYQESNSLKFKEQYSLKKNKLLAFSLDNQSTFINNSLNYTDIEKEVSYFSFLNTVNNSIVIYDYSSLKVIKTIKLQTEGPDGVGILQFPSAHLLINLDSIYVYNILEGHLYLINQNGKVINKKLLIDYANDKYNGCPEPSTGNPIIRIKQNIYLPCNLNSYQKNYDNYHSVLNIDLNLDNAKYIFKLPEIYNKAFWGQSFKYLVSLCFNPDNNRFILNYPVDPFIYEASIDGEIIDKHYIGSSFFEGIPAMLSDVQYGVKKDPYSDDIRQKEYSFSTSDYNSILYDKYRKLYYRIAYLRPDMNDIRKNNFVPDISVIIIDTNISKVGEKLLEKKFYDPSMFFVSKNGLNVARKDLYNQNENFIQFELFDIIKNEK